MKKLLMLLVLMMLVGPVWAKTYVPTQSILPLQIVNDDNKTVNICTAFSINKERGLWMTASHCYSEHVLFQGHPVQWGVYDTDLDFAIFVGGQAPSIKLAIKAPDIGDEVSLSGYPHGALDLLTFFGRIASPYARLTPSLAGTVINIVGLPGDSGGPILDASRRVVGIGQSSNQTGVVWGTPWKALKDFAGQYWDN